MLLPAMPVRRKKLKRKMWEYFATDIPALVNFAKENAVDLTIVGPEAPLVCMWLMRSVPKG